MTPTMWTRSLGPGAPDVSAIGFGAMRLSYPGRPLEDGALRVLHAALDAGITLIDTAFSYCLDKSEQGHNERLIAKALKTWGGARDGIVVATKGGIRGGARRGRRDARPEALQEACERSLRMLEVDCITLYQLHAPDPRLPFADSVGALADLQRAGKIRFVGVSNVSLEQLRAAETAVRLVTVQNRLNPFFRDDLSNGVLDYCRARGIGYLAYGPVGGSQLHEELTRHPTLLAVARRHEVSPSAVVLAWLLGLAPNVIPIPSARTEPHVRDSAAAGDLELSVDEATAINAAVFSRPRPPLLQRIKAQLGRHPALQKTYWWLRGQLGS